MKCLNCGNEMSNNDIFCNCCGSEAVQHCTNEESTFCANCGAKLKSGMKFCIECGTCVGNSDKSNTNYVFCGNCGERILDTLEVCPRCGQKLHIDFNLPITKERPKKRYGIIIAVLIAIIFVLGAMMFGYMVYVNSTESDENIENVHVTVSPMASETPAATPVSTDNQSEDRSTHISSNIGKMETYYVVNCHENISLREYPSTSAKVIRSIPLGAPVSYVEVAQNGFAKIIYNGTEGYALQSYLSNNPDEIRKPDYNNPMHGENNNINIPTTDDKTVDNQSPEVRVIRSPSYNTYSDADYNFSCWYPTHFQLYNEYDNFVRYSLKAVDNTATLKICGAKNSSNLSVKNVLYNFKSSYPGSTDYENSGSDWCACRTYKDGIYHYCYFKLKDGMIRGFELHFDGGYFEIYDGYVNDIYGSLKFN